jgi:pimeloyl-ACP methyl ester carboxylesterase
MTLRFAHLEPRKRTFPYPFLFIHGAWSSKGVWHGTQVMCRRMGIGSYAVNLQPTKPDLRNITFDTYVGTVKRMLDEIGEPTIIVGHSLGALIAQDSRISRHRNTLAAVLIASAPPFIGLSPMFYYMSSPDIRTLLSELRYWQAIWWGEPIPADIKSAEKLGLPSGRYAHMLRAESGKVIRQIVVGQGVERIHRPTLVIACKDDRLVREAAQQAVAGFHRAELWTLNHGHMAMLEPHWPGTWARILGWIETHVGLAKKKKKPP